MPIVHLVPAGDLALSESGDLQVVTGAEEVRQAIMARLRFFKGEWFRDLREGMPYYQTALVDGPPNLELVRSIFRRAILATPGVLALSSLTLTPDWQNRTLLVEFRAHTVAGEVTQPLNPAFVIRL